MIGAHVVENAGAVQEVVHQRIASERISS
jgi:hypothetical protein